MAEANDRKMKKAKIVKAATLVLTLVNIAVLAFGAFLAIGVLALVRAVLVGLFHLIFRR